MHNLIGPRRLGIAREIGLIIEGLREHRDESFEGRKIALHRRNDRFFHEMIARDEKRIGRAHPAAPFLRVAILLGQAMTPLHRPFVESGWIGEERAHA